MFEVLAFVYENYWGADSCPELPVLQRKLHALGFAGPEVITALLWLEDLKRATHRIGRLAELHLPAAAEPAPCASDGARLPGAGAMRVLTDAEQTRLGSKGWDC